MGKNQEMGQDKCVEERTGGMGQRKTAGCHRRGELVENACHIRGISISIL